MANIAMTGNSGANRTFRSIFSDQRQRHDEALKLELAQNDSKTSRAGNSSARGTGLTIDDYDETMWSEDLPLDGDAKIKNNDDLSRVMLTHQKSMDEWMDDDDDEENWKDALQDRVNQLELTYQDTAAPESQCQVQPQLLPRCVDFSQSLPVSSRFTGLNGTSEWCRQSGRHKVQRKPSTSARTTGGNDSASSRQNSLRSFQRKVMGATATPLNQDSRTQSTSIDFVAHNIQTVDQPRSRSGSFNGSAIKTSSPRHIDSPRDLSDKKHSSLSRSSTSLSGNKLPVEGNASGGTVFNMSETEAIRRFVLDDVKTMSMERLVGNAQRLHFLERFYQNYHESSMTTTTISSPPPASSFSTFKS